MNSPTLRAHLEGEVNRLHRERRNGTIFSIVIVVIVLAYAIWFDLQVQYWSRPDNLALASAGLVEAYIPSLKRAATETVQKEAPALAVYVGDQVSNEVPRLLRAMIASMVTQYADKLSEYAAGKYVDAFSTLIDDTRAELKQAIATDANQTQEALVVAAIERQFQGMLKRVDDGELAGDPLYVQIEKSHQALGNLNQRLQKLLAQDDAKVARKDKLTKRFLGTFWRFVQQENPDVKATDDPDAKRPAAK